MSRKTTNSNIVTFIVYFIGFVTTDKSVIFRCDYSTQVYLPNSISLEKIITSTQIISTKIQH